MLRGFIDSTEKTGDVTPKNSHPSIWSNQRFGVWNDAEFKSSSSFYFGVNSLLQGVISAF